MKRQLRGWLSKWGVGLDEIHPEIDALRIQHHNGSFIEIELAEDEEGYVQIHTSAGRALKIKTSGSQNALLIAADRENT